MSDEQQQGEWTDGERAERAIVLQVLRDDHPEQWTRGELKEKIEDRTAQMIADALTRLEAEGVVILNAEQVWASRCARHIDSLGMICV
jgi:DNA-binding HxlR family transcriptional regulator